MSIERNLRLALHQLVEAIEYTPMGVRGIKAMANARKALEAAQQPATAIACGIPGMAKTTCPYCEQGFAFEHEQPATGEPEEWNSIQIASWIGSQLMHEPSMFERATVCKFIRSLGRHPTLLKHSPKIRPAPSVPAASEPVVSRNPFASRCYTMSESHLSGHRLIVGFEKLGDAQDAHEWVARQGRGDFTHPAPSVPDGYVLVPIEPTQAMMNAQTWDLRSFYSPREIWAAMLAAAPVSHPAPSVPNLIEKAISSGYFDVLPVKATIPMCKAGWGASGGELTFQQIGHIYEEMYKARPLPDDAMIAAKEAT